MIISDRLRGLRGHGKLPQEDNEKRTGLFRRHISRGRNGGNTRKAGAGHGSTSAPDLPQWRTDTEAEALRLAQAGDADAFKVLYQMHCRRVYALCLRMTSNPTEAQDLTQDVFLQLFRKIQSFRGDSSFSTWLHRVTMNTVLMKFRKKRLPEVSLDNPVGSDDETPLQAFEIGEPDLRVRGTLDRVVLDRAIQQLPNGYKAMFILHDIQGYSHGEIAGILGCSSGNTKSQLHKARLRLRELLTQRIRHADGDGGTRRSAHLASLSEIGDFRGGTHNSTDSVAVPEPSMPII